MRDSVNSRWLQSVLFRLYFGGGVERCPQAAEAVGWLSSSVIHDRHARLPHKTHIVGFNLDLNHQPLPEGFCRMKTDDAAAATADGCPPSKSTKVRARCRGLNDPYVCCPRVAGVATSHSVNVQRFSFICFFFVFLQVAHLYQWLYFYILCNQRLNGRNARRSSIKQCNFPFKLQTFGLMFWLLDLSFRATSNPPAKFVNLLGRKVLVLSLLLFE